MPVKRKRYRGKSSQDESRNSQIRAKFVFRFVGDNGERLSDRGRCERGLPVDVFSLTVSRWSRREMAKVFTLEREKHTAILAAYSRIYS